MEGAANAAVEVSELPTDDPEASGAAARTCNGRCPSRFVMFTVPTKVLLYGSLRLLYPFLNFLATDWGLTRAEMGYVLAAGELAGIPGGLLTSLADEFGNRPVGIVSYVLFFAASLAMMAPPSLVGLIVVRALLHMSATVYLVTSQSSLVASQGQDMAGWITGISETGWALSVLTLVPILSVVLENLGWQAMFGVASALIGLFVAEIAWDFPTRAQEEAGGRKDALPALPVADSRNGSNGAAPNGGLPGGGPRRGIQSTVSEDDRTLSFRRKSDDRSGAAAAAVMAAPLGIFRRLRATRYWRTLTSPGPVLYNLSSVVFSISHNMLFIGFANWAEEEHGLAPEEMGAASFAIGAAELIGSVCVIFLADRLGIYRSLFYAMALYGVLSLAFAGLSELGVAGGIVGACLLFTPGEYVIVGKIALAERYVEPDLRTTMVGVNFQGHFAGRAIGALLAEAVWNWNRVLGVSITAICCVAGSMTLLYFSGRYLVGSGPGEGGDGAAAAAGAAGGAAANGTSAGGSSAVAELDSAFGSAPSPTARAAAARGLRSEVEMAVERGGDKASDKANEEGAEAEAAEPEVRMTVT